MVSQIDSLPIALSNERSQRAAYFSYAVGLFFVATLIGFGGFLVWQEGHHAWQIENPIVVVLSVAAIGFVSCEVAVGLASLFKIGVMKLLIDRDGVHLNSYRLDRFYRWDEIDRADIVAESYYALSGSRSPGNIGFLEIKRKGEPGRVARSNRIPDRMSLPLPTIKSIIEEGVERWGSPPTGPSDSPDNGA